MGLGELNLLVFYIRLYHIASRSKFRVFFIPYPSVQTPRYLLPHSVAPTALNLMPARHSGAPHRQTSSSWGQSPLSLRASSTCHWFFLDLRKVSRNDVRACDCSYEVQYMSGETSAAYIHGHYVALVQTHVRPA